MTYSRIGIIGIEYQLPRFVIKQEEISLGLDIDINKLKIGLGLEEFSVPDRNEDCVSLALSALSNLLNKYNVDINDVGKIEVGSESNFDGAKSIKSYLTDLFGQNTSISGCDNVNACYGGTNALLNSLAWLDSCMCNSKFAIVVCTDISLYQEKAAIPTSGGGAVAMLLGRDPVLALVPEMLRHYSSNESDFLKPYKTYPFPEIKGKESIDVYRKAFNKMYQGSHFEFDYIVFHTPYPKIVQKVCHENGIETSKYISSLLTSKRNGNSYTASLYFCLISLLDTKTVGINKRILLYSFGSGCVSTLLCFEKVKDGCDNFDLLVRLNSRKSITFIDYLDIVNNYDRPSTISLDKSNNADGRYVISKIEGGFRHYSK